MVRPNNGISPRAAAEAKFNGARMNLIIITLFTVLNIFMIIFGTDMIMLFSASVPYYTAGFGKIFAAELGIPALYYVSIAMAFLLCLPYFLCWIFSKKHFGWMITALICFAVDSLVLMGFVMLGFVDIRSMLLDIVFHAWVMYYLILGVKNGIKLKTLSEGEPAECAGGCECGEHEYIPGGVIDQAANSETPEETAAEADSTGNDNK